MNLITKLTLGVAAVSALACALELGRYGAPAPAAPASAARELETLAAQVSQLRQELTRTQSLIRERRARPEPEDGAPSAVASAAPEPVQAPERDAHEAVPSLEETRDLLEARFSAEDGDAAWSRDARAQAQAVVAAKLPRSAQLRSLECKESLCRAEIEQPDEDAHRAYLEQTFARPLEEWTGQLMASLVELPSGGVTTVVFLARPGTELVGDAELSELR